MGYSELLEYVKSNNEKGITEIVNEMKPVLIRYLMYECGALREDAQDCIQEALIIALDRIKADAIENPDSILSFLMTTCRNEYYNKMRKISEQPYGDLPYDAASTPKQFSNLYSEDQKKIVEYCLQKLSNTLKTFIHYWLEHPNYGAKQISSHFDITEATAWTRKHRAINHLRDCVNKTF